MSSFSYSQIVQQSSQVAQGQQITQTMQRQKLVRTDQPVWPEDESREEVSGPSVRLADPEEQDQILERVSLALPDVLLWEQLAGDKLSENYNRYLLMNLPVSFSADDGLTPKRLKLSVQLSVEDPPMFGLPWPLPVAIWMRPSPAVDVKSVDVAHLGFDLGKIVGNLSPLLSDAFTVSADATIKINHINPRIQATGLLRTDCEWIIADTQIAYGFRPALVAQLPILARVLVKAKAHVEVQRKFMHAYHKAYGISQIHREYHYDPLGRKSEHELSPWLPPQEESRTPPFGGEQFFITAPPESVAQQWSKPDQAPPS